MSEKSRNEHDEKLLTFIVFSFSRRRYILVITCVDADIFSSDDPLGLEKNVLEQYIAHGKCKWISDTYFQQYIHLTHLVKTSV